METHSAIVATEIAETEKFLSLRSLRSTVATVAKIAECMFPYTRKDRCDRSAAIIAIVAIIWKPGLRINFTCVFKVFQIALAASRLGQFSENFENTREVNP